MEVVENIFKEYFKEIEYSDDKMYYVKGKKKGSFKCVFKRRLYYISPDSTDIFYCAYRQDPCHAKVIKDGESFKEEGKHVCKNEEKRNIDHVGLEIAENCIRKMCKDTTLTYRKIIEIVQER
ncbi:uncharacterized protein LOC122503252 [Leptopilina heterotoma]|uniref:uncharacterized protein LOC122503252 n=1 Tax=Leptopilina heterotoma TaxID=63436 RepID=UPI001CA87DBA|nr:uncharacterized protein LOC122503252 [Leptopilina heterotoma]